jgi:hypothetical protein
MIGYTSQLADRLVLDLGHHYPHEERIHTMQISPNGIEFACSKSGEIGVRGAFNSHDKPSGLERDGVIGETESREQVGNKGMTANRSPTRSSNVEYPC